MLVSTGRGRIYLATFLFALHYALTLYINSSFLSNYFSASEISLLFVFGAFLSMVLFSYTPRIIDAIGVKRLLFYSLVVDFLSVLGILSAKNPATLALAFTIYSTVILLIPLCLDIFLEARTREAATGRIRGTNLTAANVAILLAPLIVAYVVFDGHFSLAYIISAIVLVPLTALALFFPNLHTVFHGQNHSFYILLRIWQRHVNVRRVTVVRFALESFYTVMVIYTPLYLSQVIGFDWHTIGLIFTIMLLPFVLFEGAIGWLADRVYGEKEIMTLGLCVMSVSLILILNLGACVAAWAIILFLSRVGAAAIEITTESYFFKNVGADDAGLISIFRLTRPISIIFGALVGGLILSLYSYQMLFAVLAGFIFLTTLFSTRIKDTR